MSEAIALSGVQRKESRGAHFREDFRDKDPGHFAKVNHVLSKDPGGDMQIREERVVSDF